MRQYRGRILRKTEEGYLVGVPPSMEREFKTKTMYKVGQIVYVCYNFIKREIVSISSTPFQETDAPPIGPLPPFTGHPADDTIPEVEVEEEDWAFPEGTLTHFGVVNE